MSQTFLRFAGRLEEDDSFERARGWETSHIARRPPEGSSEYRVLLFDAEDRMLLEKPVHVDFLGVCDRETEARTARVCCYVPLPRGACELRFVHRDRALHSEPIAERPPRVRITRVRSGRGRVTAEWQTDAARGRAVTYNVVYLPTRGRGFLVRKNLARRRATIDLAGLPGSRRARLAVLATDGTRSGFAVSRGFPVPDKPASVSIARPEDGERFAAHADVTLCGRAYDVAGATLPDAGLRWLVDDEAVEEGRCLALARRLPPGRHRVTLQHRRGRRVVAQESVTIEMARETPEQRRFEEIAQALRESPPPSGGW